MYSCVFVHWDELKVMKLRYTS